MGLLARRTGRGCSQAPASFLRGEPADQPSDGNTLAAAFCEPGHFLDENDRRTQRRVERIEATQGAQILLQPREVFLKGEFDEFVAAIEARFTGEGGVA